MQDVQYLAALIIGMVAFGIIISGATAFAQVTLNGFSGSAESIQGDLGERSCTGNDDSECN